MFTVGGDMGGHGRKWMVEEGQWKMDSGLGMCE